MPRSFEDKYEVNLEFSSILSNRFNDLKNEIKVQLPCKVVETDHANNQVTVQILDYDHNEKGELVDYPLLPNIPIRQPVYSGSAYMILPVRVGDIGTIEFFDSSIDDILATGSFDYDYSEDWHDLNYGLFTNGFLPYNKVVPIDSTDKIILATHSGKFTFRVTGNDELEVVAPSIKATVDGGIEFNTPDLNVSGDVTVGNGASGTVACQGSILTVTNGIVTSIV